MLVGLGSDAGFLTALCKTAAHIFIRMFLLFTNYSCNNHFASFLGC